MSTTAPAVAEGAAPDGAQLEADLLIIGAGPAGLYAAYYASFRQLSVLVLDSLEEPGGQVTALYPEKLIYDVAGFPAIKGRELITNLMAQLEPFAPAFLLGERAEHLEATGEEVRVTTDTGTTIVARSALITGGIGTFTPKPLPAAEGFTGTGLIAFVKEPAQLAGQDVVIVGGGDSAFDWAVTLDGIARSIALVHRRDRFRAHEHTVQQVRDSDTDIIVNAEVAELLVEDGAIAGVVIEDRETGQRHTRPAQTVVAALGFTADLGPVKRWGVEQNGRQIVVDTTMATTLPRVFAAGDIATYPGKVNLISVGFGEAAIAVNNAAVAIDPEARLFPGHSSDSK